MYGGYFDWGGCLIFAASFKYAKPWRAMRARALPKISQPIVILSESRHRRDESKDLLQFSIEDNLNLSIAQFCDFLFARLAIPLAYSKQITFLIV